jgi:uncharacterized membrane protein
MLLTVVTASEWAILLVFTLLMLHNYAHESSGYLVKFFTFIGWFMGFSIIAILPLDILIVRVYLSHPLILRLKTMISS